jgi:hypothetical protein
MNNKVNVFFLGTRNPEVDPWFMVSVVQWLNSIIKIVDYFPFCILPLSKISLLSKLVPIMVTRCFLTMSRTTDFLVYI